VDKHASGPKVRGHGSETEQLDLVSFAGFTLDIAGCILTDPDGREVPLRRSEFVLLLAFLRAAGRVLSRDHLLDAVAGRLSAPYDRSIDVLVGRLRRKIEADPKSPRLIRTVSGMGYQFTERPLHLRARSDPETEPEPEGVPLRPRPAERRQLTVMLCGLAGMAALSARLDPEDVQPLIDSYHACCSQVIASAGGVTAKFMNDAVLAYFGYPRATEHDAERAIRTGLATIEAVAQLDSRLHCRIGLATGLVVLSNLTSDTSGAPSVLGEAPDLAARLLALAAPDTVVISEGCHRLTRGVFDYKTLPLPGDGSGRSVPAFQVIGEAAIESRFEALHDRGLTPLVGREDELVLLTRRWQQAQGGAGKVVLIAGEPGFGKSRLVREFRCRLVEGTYTPLTCSCAPHRQDSAYFPFMDHLTRAAGFARSDGGAVRLGKLEALLQRTGLGLDAIGLFADLLSVPTGGPALNLSPRQRRARTEDALVGQVGAIAARQPVLLVFEDVHWIDPTSLDVLDALVDRVTGLPVLLLITYRLEFVPHWTSRAHATTIILNGFDRFEAAEMVEQIAGAAVPQSVRGRIIDQADGVPLFVEELAKAVLEGASAPEDTGGKACSVPATLQSSLMARLDSMPMAKAVAQVGSVIGRDFPHHVIAAVADLPGPDLRQGLDELVGSSLVYRRGELLDSVYTFKHALVRDAAYETLVRGRRLALHAALAKELAARSEVGEAVRPEVLGHHYEQGGMVPEAIRCYVTAGTQSAARSALTEAAALLERARGLISHLTAGAARDRLSLEVECELGSVQIAVKGYAAPELGATFTRARDLWDRLGRPPEFRRVPWGQWLFHANRSELDQAAQHADGLLAFGRSRNDIGSVVLGALSRGGTHMAHGEPVQATPCLEEVLRLCTPTVQSQLIRQAGLYPDIMALGFLSLVLAWQGFPERALARSLDAIERARRSAHAPTLGSCFAMTGRMASMLGQETLVAESAQGLAVLAREHGYPVWSSQAPIYEAWLRLRHGEIASVLQLMRKGLEDYRASGMVVWSSYLTILLTEAMQQTGQASAALSLLETEFATVEQTGELWCAAELCRRRGELLLKLPQPNPTGAKMLFLRGIEIAKSQSAKLWELRAATSLARLWIEQARQSEAQDLLAPIYAWFTEGFEMEDLKEARALLIRLGALRE
jgi:class 3 adenylate cyclase